MTETTNIAALIKSAMLSCSEGFASEIVDSLAFDIGRDLDHAEHAQVFDAVSRLLDTPSLLEAERQRADALESVALALRDDMRAAREEISALKANLANPVVLHNERDHYQDTDEYEQGYVLGYNASRRNSVADIEKAGFTVKGE